MTIIETTARETENKVEFTKKDAAKCAAIFAYAIAVPSPTRRLVRLILR